MKRLMVVAAGAIALTFLAGCGIKGDLARPGPMWGHPEQPPAPTSSNDDENKNRDRHHNSTDNSPPLPR